MRLRLWRELLVCQGTMGLSAGSGLVEPLHSLSTVNSESSASVSLRVAATAFSVPSGALLADGFAIGGLLSNVTAEPNPAS